MSFKPCVFYIKGQEKPLSYDEFRAYLADNYDTLVEPKEKPSKLRDRATQLRERAAKLREQAGGTLSAAPNALATAFEVYAAILDGAASIKEAIDEFRASKEYKALGVEDKAEMDAILAEDESLFSEDVEVIEKTLEQAASGEESIKSFIASIQNAENLSKEDKKRVNDAITGTYNTLTSEDLDKYGAAIVESYGGLESAVKEAMKENSKMVAAVRIYVMAQAIKDTKERRAKAKTQKEQDEISDEQIKYFNFVDEFGRGLGRAVNAIKLVYALDNLAVVRDVKNKAEKHNKIFNENATKQAKEVARILEEEGDVAEAMEKAAESEDAILLTERIKQLEDELKKVRATKDVATKKKTTRKPRFTDEDLAKARKELFGGLSANPFLDPRKWEALSTMAMYYMERGFYAFEDFYKKIRKDLNGKYEEYYGDVYNNVKQTLIEQGVNPKEFDEDVIVQKVAEELFQQEARLQAKLENERNKLQFSRLLSERNKNIENKPAKSKDEKLEELASKIDEYEQGDVYTNLFNQYSGITEQQAKENKINKLSEKIQDLMNPKENKQDSERVSSEERLLNLASELDNLVGGDTYSKAVTEHLRIKEEEKELQEREKFAAKVEERQERERIAEQNEKSRREISKRKRLLNEFNSKLFPKPNENTERKERTLSDIASELDKEFGTDTYSKMAKNAEKVKESIRDQRKKEAEKEALRKRFENRIEEKQESSEEKSKPMTLKEMASKLDKEFGTDEYTKKAEYFEQKQLDAKAKAETKAEMKRFASLMQEKPLGQKDATQRKTREEKIKELAAKLDEKFGTNVYSKQAEAYINSQSTTGNVKQQDLLKQALIDAGFSKEVTNPKTKKKEVKVDWKALAADSKNIDETVSKIEKVLKDKLPKEQLDLLLTTLKNKAEQVIIDQKRKAVANFINVKNRSKTARVSKALKRNKTQIEKLLKLWKEGGLSDKAVKEILSEELGIISITDEVEKEIEKRLNDIDAAPVGAEREKLEEDLQAYIDYLGINGVSLAMFDRLRLRLFGPFTLLKNLTGVTVAATMSASLIIRNNLPLLTQKGGDKYIAKVAGIAARKSMAVMGDMMMNGGVDLGSAFSETTGTKEGTPRIRHGEYTYRRKWFNKPLNIMGRNVNLYNFLYDREKYISRTMSATDAFSHLVLMELKAYDEMKHLLRKNNPTMSNSEASEKAFEIMYGDSFAEANAKALSEFESRGIDLDFDKKADRARFKRRVFEMVQQKREEKIQKASILFANIHTFKAFDYGVTTPFAALIGGVKTGLYSIANKIEASSRKSSPDNIESKTAKQTANLIRKTTEFAFVKFVPFVNGVANILEKGFELTPYGVVKGAAQAGYVTISGESDTYTYRRAYETTFRGAFGTILTLLIAGMLTDDEDDDKIPDLFGEGPTDPAMRSVANKAHQTNTISIKGHKIPLDYLGTLGIPLKILGNYFDKNRYKEEKPEGVKEVSAYIGGIALSSMNDLYLEQLSDAIRQAKGTDPSKFLSAQTSELFTRYTIPYIATFRQANNVAFPQATVPIGLADNLAKYSGIIAGWSVDRPNFDYRGKTYDIGQKYTGSPDGFFKSFMKTYTFDGVDAFVLKYSPRLPYQKQSSYEVPLDALGAASAPLSDEMFYELKYNTAKNFGALIEAYYATDPENAPYKIKGMTEKTIQKAAEKAAQYLLQQEGIPVNLQDEEYLKKLNARIKEVKMSEDKAAYIKSQIDELFEVAEAAAMYDLVQKTGGVHTSGTEGDKAEFDRILGEMQIAISK